MAVVSFAGGRTVQRVPFVAKSRDAHRAEVIERGAPVDVPRAALDPLVMTESDGSLIEQPAVLYVDPSVPTHPLDQWRVDGELYEVLGVPLRIRNDYTGRQFDTEIQLKRVTG